MTLRWLRLPADSRGVISVELALTSSLVLLPTILATWDMAVIIRTRALLDQTLQTAFYYAWANNGAVTTTNVQSTALAAYGTSTPQPSVTATITQYCITPAVGYPATGSPPTPVAGICAGGTTLEYYLSVTASVSVTNTFLVSYFANPFNISDTSQGRIQ